MQNKNQSSYSQYVKVESSHRQDHPSSYSIHKKGHKKNPNLVDGSWTSSENLKYAVFVEKHQAIFICKNKRKVSRIYTYLSKFLKSRTAQQCRSHFQKIILKYNNIHAFIGTIKDAFGETIYAKIFDNCLVAEDAFYSINQPIENHQRVEPITKKEIGVQTDPEHSMIPHMIQKMQKGYQRAYQGQHYYPWGNIIAFTNQNLYQNGWF